MSDSNAGLSLPTAKIWFNDHESAVSPIINFDVIFTVASLLFNWAGTEGVFTFWMYSQVVIILIFSLCLLFNPQLLMAGKIYLALQKLAGIGEKDKKKYTVEEGEIVQPLKYTQTISARARIAKIKGTK